MSQETQLGKENAIIEVIGKAETEISPDELFIAFWLKAKFPETSKFEILSQEAEVRKQLTNAGINVANLNSSEILSGFNVIKRQVNAPVASKEYILKVGNHEQAVKAIGILDLLKVSDVGIQRVGNTEIEKYRNQIRSLAIDDARKKATSLLAEFRKTIGEPMFIQEHDIFNEYQQPYSMHIADPMNSNLNMIQQDSIADTFSVTLPDIEYQKIKVKYAVTVRFEIK